MKGEILHGMQFFKCPHCHKISFLKGDIDNRYCGNCKEFVRPMKMFILENDTVNTILGMLIWSAHKTEDEGEKRETVKRIEEAINIINDQIRDQNRLAESLDENLKKRYEDIRETSLVMKETRNKLEQAISSLKVLNERVFEEKANDRI